VSHRVQRVARAEGHRRTGRRSGVAAAHRGGRRTGGQDRLTTSANALLCGIPGAARRESERSRPYRAAAEWSVLGHGPERFERECGEAVAHGMCAVPGVSHVAADEPFPKTVAQDRKPGRVFRLHCCRRFRLDAYYASIVSFQDQVDLQPATVPVVVHGSTLLAPSELAAHLPGHETLPPTP